MEHDVLFDVSFDEENSESDNQNILKAEIREESHSETLVVSENEESVDSSSSDETQNHVES